MTTNPEKNINARVEIGKKNPISDLERHCIELGSRLDQYGLAYGIPGQEKQREKMIPKLFNQCEATVQASLGQSRDTLKRALKAARENMGSVKEPVFTSAYNDLREEVEQALLGMKSEFPKNIEDGVDGDAIFLRNDGRINLTMIERYREQFTKWLKTSPPGIRIALEHTLAALTAYQDLQMKESFFRNPHQPIPNMLPTSVTEGKENFAFRLVGAGLAGILGIATLGIAMRTPGKDIRLPALYLTLAALFGMGEKRLTQPQSEALRQEVEFLGSASHPYQRIVKAYGIRGPAWAEIAGKIQDMDNSDFTEDQEKILHKMARGEAPATPAERDFLLKKFATSDPAVREQLKNMVEHGKDFLQFQSILQKSRSEEADAIVKESIKIGCDETAFKTFIDATKDADKA